MGNRTETSPGGLGRPQMALLLTLCLVACGGDGSPTSSDPGRGSIQVTASTSNNLDPNGFVVFVDGDSAAVVEANGTVMIDGVPEGHRRVSLDDIVPYCAPDGQNVQTASVLDGQTAFLSFTVTCIDPPGGRIFFNRSGPGESWISAMNADGSGMIDLVRTNGRSSRITFSPDGEQVAFSAFVEATLHLFVMNKDGSGVTQLTSNQDAYEGHPSWSPDGTKLAFRTGGESFQIAVVATDGSGVTRLTHDVGLWSSWPDWSPDGSRIAFSRQTQFQSLESDDRIFVMNADGTGAEALTSAAPVCDQAWGFGWPRWHDHHPQWSPEGTRILFARYFECGDDSYEAIFTMNADGSDPVEFLRNAHGAAWSPDGSQIAYIQDHIYVVTATGSGMVRESRGWERGEEYSQLAWTR